MVMPGTELKRSKSWLSPTYRLTFWSTEQSGEESRERETEREAVLSDLVARDLVLGHET